MSPKTDVHVKLVGEDGNAFAILGKTKKALIKAGYKDLAEQYMKEATSGDYDHLLAVTQQYVEVE
jgi:hypothetical protein